MCTPTSFSWLPVSGNKAEHRTPRDRAERGREWDHCHNYTIKSSSQQNHKTGLLSGGWPGWLATTCPAFLCDTVLCHFLHRETEGRATSEEAALFLRVELLFRLTMSASMWSYFSGTCMDICHWSFYFVKLGKFKLRSTHARGYAQCHVHFMTLHGILNPYSWIQDYGSLCHNKGHSSHRKYIQVCRHSSFPTIHMDCCN